MKRELFLEQYPNIVSEIILRVKVKDAMSDRLITASETTTLREIQKIMRREKISGVPIVEKERLMGIVSVDDIISALDNNYIDDTVANHMTRKVVVLEDDMPLNFAISYFEKYRFGRFPVISKDKKMVGIITSRDILTSLVEELNKEISQLEEKLPPEKMIASPNLENEYPVARFDFENAGKASFEIKKILKERGVSSKVIRRAAIAAYELEINIAIHSAGGKMIFRMDDDSITIIARDTGPGIIDTSQAVQEGFSTANDWIRSLGFGAGMGLPNVKRVSDKFEIESEVGKGTTVTSIINCKEEE